MMEPKLQQTKAYGMFEPHPHNRDVRRTKLLEQSMTRNGYDPGFPIRVVKNGNGKFKITHGHHRFHVARKLGLPLYYIECKDTLPLFDSEATSRSWNCLDYTTARARGGDAAAAEVLRYHQETGITIGASCSLLGGEQAASSNKQRAMQKGLFQIGDTTHAEEMAYMVSCLSELGIKFTTNSAFIAALSKALLVEYFCPETFLRRVRVNIANMEKRRNQDGYLELIEEIYNKRQRRPRPLKFDAIEESKKRSAIKTK